VSIGGFEVREHSWLILVHTGPDAPEWEVPEIPEATAPEFAGPIDDVQTARNRTSELRMLYHVRKPTGLPFLAPVLKLVFRSQALGEVL
jgi:hypothetical protein